MKRRPDLLGIAAWLSVFVFVALVVVQPLELPYRAAYIGILAPMVALVLIAGRGRP